MAGQARGQLHYAISAQHSHTHHYFKAKHQVAHKYGTVRPFARVPFTPKSTYHPRYCSMDRHLNRVNKSLQTLPKKQRKKIKQQQLCLNNDQNLKKIKAVNEVR